jgi:predicted house-cleaning noncanonical NTP pyrophosphatase (MazG superfamily)
MPDHDPSSARSDDRATGESQGNEYVGAYDKLVRDDIPDVVRDDGNHPVTRRVDGREYERYLATKLEEEAREYATTVESNPADANDADDTDAGHPSSGDELEELADVHAVFEAIVAASDHSMTTIRERAREKALARGGFDDGIVLERIEPTDD